MIAVDAFSFFTLCLTPFRVMMMVKSWSLHHLFACILQSPEEKLYRWRCAYQIEVVLEMRNAIYFDNVVPKCNPNWMHHIHPYMYTSGVLGYYHHPFAMWILLIFLFVSVNFHVENLWYQFQWNNVSKWIFLLDLIWLSFYTSIRSISSLKFEKCSFLSDIHMSTTS